MPTTRVSRLSRSQPLHHRRRACRVASRSPAASCSRWAATPASTCPTRSCRPHAGRTGPRLSRRGRLDLPRQHRLRLRRQRHRRLLRGPERPLCREPRRRDDGGRRIRGRQVGLRGDLGARRRLRREGDGRADALRATDGVDRRRAPVGRRDGRPVLARGAEQVGDGGFGRPLLAVDGHDPVSRPRLRGFSVSDTGLTRPAADSADAAR